MMEVTYTIVPFSFNFTIVRSEEGLTKKILHRPRYF